MSGNIQGMVVGFVIALVGIVLYGEYAGAADGLYREFVDSCEVSGQSVLKGTVTANTLAEPAVGTVLNAAADGDGCQFTGTFTAAAVVTIVGENGQTLGTTTVGEAAVTTIPITGGIWTPVPEQLERFASLNRLMAEIIPLLVVVGFVSTAYLVTGRINQGSESIGNAIKNEIGALVLSLVGIYLLPVFTDFVVEAASTNDGGLSVTGRFGSLGDLIFSILPLLLTVGIATLMTRKAMGANKMRSGTHSAQTAG